MVDRPEPDIRVLADAAAEQRGVADRLHEHVSAGLKPHEFGILVRSDSEAHRARAAAEAAELPYPVLDEHLESVSGYASISTIDLAKGWSFALW